MSVLASAATVTAISAADNSSHPSSSSSLDPVVRFRSLQYALFTTCFVEVLGGLFFLLTALHVVEDRAAAERHLQGISLPLLVPRQYITATAATIRFYYS